MRILVVDDHILMRRIIIRLLHKLGHTECYEASNGREAIRHLSDRSMDLVITDWVMPEMNGLEFIQTMRANHSMSDVPVLMVTTNDNKDDVLDALQAGVTNYIVKPFKPDTMMAKVRSLLAKRAAEAAPRPA